MSTCPRVATPRSDTVDSFPGWERTPGISRSSLVRIANSQWRGHGIPFFTLSSGSCAKLGLVRTRV